MWPNLHPHRSRGRHNRLHPRHPRPGSSQVHPSRLDLRHSRDRLNRPKVNRGPSRSRGSSHHNRVHGSLNLALLSPSPGRSRDRSPTRPGTNPNNRGSNRFLDSSRSRGRGNLNQVCRSHRNRGSHGRSLFLDNNHHNKDHGSLSRAWLNPSRDSRPGHTPTRPGSSPSQARHKRNRDNPGLSPSLDSLNLVSHNRSRGSPGPSHRPRSRNSSQAPFGNNLRWVWFSLSPHSRRFKQRPRLLLKLSPSRSAVSLLRRFYCLLSSLSSLSAAAG